jgi:hypothetical protein
MNDADVNDLEDERSEYETMEDPELAIDAHGNDPQNKDHDTESSNESTAQTPTTD